jgi:hypothetical protein
VTGHGVPTVDELVAAVRAFLTDDVLPATEGRLHFNTRVAANVLAMVERELVLGPGYGAAHAERLAALGVADDAELAAAIRDGRMDGRGAELIALLRRRTVERLSIANPRHLQDTP